MIHVEIVQEFVLPEREWCCDVTAHHRQDGEYPAYRESFTVPGEWPAAIEVAREEYGDEISSLSVEYRKEGYS